MEVHMLAWASAETPAYIVALRGHIRYGSASSARTALCIRETLPPTQTMPLLSAMASPSTHIVFTGDGNQGLQVGLNSGDIHLAPGKCPLPRYQR
jgi:hypothetical protein